MSSFIAKPAEVERKWYVVDAEGKNLGRMASQIAAILRGKNKPTYTPHVDCGDYVIVINAEKVEVTGKKRKEKIYKRHTGYPGGLREVTFEKMMEKHPTEVVRHAVKGMMPNGKLGRQMYKKLRFTQALSTITRLRSRKFWIFREGRNLNDGKDTVLRNRKKKIFSC